MSISIGIVGGLGPKASASFLNTIYDNTSKNIKEQLMPKVFLISDPDIPSRADAIISGNHQELMSSILEKINVFKHVNVDIIIICCIAVHYFIPQMPNEFKSKIYSILDDIVDYVAKQKTVALCAGASIKTKLFESHKDWNLISNNLIFLTEDEQKQLDDIILYVKNNEIDCNIVKKFTHLLDHYSENMIVSCSEIHMLFKHIEKEKYSRVFDPFNAIGKKLSFINEGK